MDQTNNCEIKCCEPLQAYNAHPSPENIDRLVTQCGKCISRKIPYYIRKFVSSTEEIKDINQEAWIRFIKRLHKGDKIENVQAYYCQVVKSVLSQKKNSRIRTVPFELSLEGTVLPRKSPSYMEDELSDEATKLLMALRDKLTPREFQVLNIRMNDPDIKNKEIAKLLGIGVRRVENIQTSLRQKASDLKNKHPELFLTHNY